MLSIDNAVKFNPNRIFDPTDFYFSYYVDEKVRRNVEDGSTTIINSVVEYSDESLYKAFYITQALAAAEEFMGECADGTIDNCHVTGAEIVNQGRTTGGLAGIVVTVTNSSVSKSTIIGLGGNAAGFASEVDALIENCNATETTVVVASPAETYPSGGLVASLYEATARNCYFSGAVDAVTYETGGYVGGIAGSDCRVHNSYFIGTVISKDVATTAGITGYMNRNWDWYESIQSNCYSAGTISSGYGIMANDERNADGSYIYIMNCLTTAPHLGSADTEAEQAYTNITSIQEHLDVINGELAYSTTNIWPDYSFDCPKLRWQTTISTGTGDEGTDAPEFEEDEW